MKSRFVYLRVIHRHSSCQILDISLPMHVWLLFCSYFHYKRPGSRRSCKCGRSYAMLLGIGPGYPSHILRFSSDSPGDYHHHDLGTVSRGLATRCAADISLSLSVQGQLSALRVLRCTVPRKDRQLLQGHAMRTGTSPILLAMSLLT